MNKKPNDPFPEELLPNSAIDNDPVLWENRVQNLMAAASPILAQYRTVPIPWWSVLADRLRPRLPVAAAAAAAATVMITVHLSLPGPATRSAPSLPLATVIGDGATAATILSIANEEIDPVLALVILEGVTP